MASLTTTGMPSRITQSSASSPFSMPLSLTTRTFLPMRQFLSTNRAFDHTAVTDPDWSGSRPAACFSRSCVRKKSAPMMIELRIVTPSPIMHTQPDHAVLDHRAFADPAAVGDQTALRSSRLPSATAAGSELGNRRERAASARWNGGSASARLRLAS